jgi:hypothetical protein
MSEPTDRVSTTAVGVLAGVCAGCAERDPRVRIDDPAARRMISWRDGKFAAVRVRALLPLLRPIHRTQRVRPSRVAVRRPTQWRDAARNAGPRLMPFEKRQRRPSPVLPGGLEVARRWRPPSG